MSNEQPKVVKIKTPYAGSPWIKSGKVYEATLSEDSRDKGCYRFIGELGSPVTTRLKQSTHLAGADWDIVE